MSPCVNSRRSFRYISSGFSLLEVMVALALGLLLSGGILSLFQGTSNTNRVQDGLAHLQENGRFAVTRVQDDLRRLGGQYCSNTSGKARQGAVVPMLPVRAPEVYAKQLQLPDPGPGVSGTGIAVMNSVDATGYPTVAAATTPYALSPRFFVQGYDCPTASACTSGLPTSLPPQALTANSRLPGSDVLTIRYQRGTGWPLPTGQCAHSGGVPMLPDDKILTGDTLTLSPQAGDDPISRLVTPAPPSVVLITDCVNSTIVPVSAAAGNQVTIGGILANAPAQVCTGAGTRDVRVFDFSKDFVTVSYYVGVRPDLNPDARPNSATATRLIPTLIRRENGIEQELVQGVDVMRLHYGVQDNLGNTRFMTAAQIAAAPASTCPPMPADNIPADPFLREQGCLWRAVRTIEVHLLMNTVNEVVNLDTASRQYTFDGTTTTGVTISTVLPSGLAAGSMMRREFIGYVANRNYTF
ncbi:MAG: PilW family protein [Dokdonella sp.]